MTSHSDDDPLLRDPRFDRTWRAASAEEPPAALDDAIRAVARREVGAQPRRLATDVREATRPERWWFPLAAAATIGAVAFGLLQIVGQDRLARETAPAGVVSDMAAPAAPPESRDSRAGSTAPAPAVAAPPPLTSTQTTPAAAPAAANPTAQSAPLRARGVGASPAGSVRRDADRVDTTAPNAGRPEVASAAPAPTAQPSTGVARPPAPEAAPDPATPMPGVTLSPAPPPAPTAAATRAPEPFPGAPAKEKQRGSSPVATGRALLGAPAGSLASGAAAPSGSPGASAPPPRTAERAAAATGKRVAPAADASVESQVRENTARLSLPIPEWIALIRRLRDEGRVDDAQRELVAFRKAHPDHAHLLPPDLRNWAVDAR